MTSLRSLLVHVDSSPRSALRVRAARQLAELHDAELHGLYADIGGWLAPPTAYAMSAEAVQLLVDLDRERRTAARGQFDTAVAGLARSTWAELGGFATFPDFGTRALYSDLLVLGQHEPAAAIAPSMPSGFVESVLATSGKPALVLPYAGEFDFSRPATAVIAWKASAESARAVESALPLLSRAHRVHVLCWQEGAEASPIGGADIGSYLQAHGVNAELHTAEKAPPQLGEVLLSRCTDLGADLLVMGCYGHSRAREIVLGGVTRTVLSSMTVPVLMRR